MTTSFDGQKGNLNNRSYTSNNINKNQVFGYDSLNLNRLTTTTDAGVTTTQNYDANGRISSNELGTYNYTKTTASPPNPYCNTSITIDLSNPANLAYYYNKYPLQQLTYNAFKKPVTLYDYNNERIDFQYNDFEQRSTMFYGGKQTDKLQRPCAAPIVPMAVWKLQRSTLLLVLLVPLLPILVAMPTRLL